MSVDFAKITTLLRSLTWRRVAMACTLMITVLVCGLIWYSRDRLFAEPDDNTRILINVTASKASDIKRSVVDLDLVVAIHVVSINFERNTRKSAFFYTDVPELSAIYEDYQRKRLADYPLFVQANVEENNRMIRLITGEMVCTPIHQTPAIRAFTGIQNYVTHVCSIGIPAATGKFAGYLNMYLKSEPLLAEQHQIKSFLSDLSNAIYQDSIVIIKKH